jgi:hypothetical protein
MWVQRYENYLKKPPVYKKNIIFSINRALFDLRQQKDCLRTQFIKKLLSVQKIAVPLHRQKMTTG